MTQRSYTHILLSLLAFVGCNLSPEANFDSDKTFPEVKDLSEYHKTTFLPALETPFKNSENGVYAASLGMAWNELRDAISEPIIHFDAKDLESLNNSESYHNVLIEDEYYSLAKIEDLKVIAKAYFKKSLPFVVPLEKDKKPLNFQNSMVEAFGFQGHNQSSGIIYYHNDNDFAIKLFPKDTEHEIILVKTDFEDQLVLKNEVERLEKHIRDFKKMRNEKNDWKYYYNDEDKVSIPIIEFNIQTNYPEMEGSYFSTAERRFVLDMLYQRTAFVLNEKGAEVESEAIAVATEEMEEELPQPKKMIFDQPYLILLKRKSSQYPYFAMFVSNSELMRKE